jgi:asparagine N-glycosylation enzyme membrane subunit Stt3
MATGNTNFRKLKLVAVTALVAVAVLILLGYADAPGMPAGSPVGAMVGAALQAIPCVLAQAGLQTFQACLFDHGTFLHDVQRMLLSFWLLLFFVVGTVVARSKFTSRSEGSSANSCKDFWRTGIEDVDPVGDHSTHE